jgi:hypothetical protein
MVVYSELPLERGVWFVVLEASWKVIAHAKKPDFVFRWNGRVHLNRRGRQFSRLLAAKVCASAVVVLDTPCSEVVCRVLATHFIRQIPLHFPSRASPCAITFQMDSTTWIPASKHRICLKPPHLTLNPVSNAPPFSLHCTSVRGLQEV